MTIAIRWSIRPRQALSNQQSAVSRTQLTAKAAKNAKDREPTFGFLRDLGAFRSSSTSAEMLSAECYIIPMRAVIQRVSRCRVAVDGNVVVGEIGPGLLVLLGVSKTDDEAAADYLDKIIGLRIFEDAEGKMNLSVQDSGARCWWSHSSPCMATSAGAGGRPLTRRRARKRQSGCTNTLSASGRPGLRCETGQFQAMMEVELVNSGPVTILLDSEKSS